MSNEPSREHLPVLEQYRHGLVNRWNEMMSVINDRESFKIRFRMMAAELKDLATTKEKNILERSMTRSVQDEKYTDVDNKEQAVLADKLNILSKIFRSRVITARWVLPFDPQGRSGFGQGVSYTVQQNIAANFFKIDYRSLFELFFFVRQIEVLLHNAESSDEVHTEVTYFIHNWILKWGFVPYGIPKYNPIKAPKKRSGRKTPIRMKIDARSEEYYEHLSDELHEETKMDQDDDIDEQRMIHSGPFNRKTMDLKKYEEIHKLTKRKEYTTRPNYFKLINNDPLKLLKYRNRNDYQEAVIEMMDILKLEFQFLKAAKIDLLKTWVQYQQIQSVPQG